MSFEEDTDGQRCNFPAVPQVKNPLGLCNIFPELHDRMSRLLSTKWMFMPPMVLRYIGWLSIICFDTLLGPIQWDWCIIETTDFVHYLSKHEDKTHRIKVVDHRWIPRRWCWRRKRTAGKDASATIDKDSIRPGFSCHDRQQVDHQEIISGKPSETQKSVDCRFTSIRDAVTRGILRLSYSSTATMLPDGLTKALGTTRFREIRAVVDSKNFHAALAEKC
ncbi:hypothetical protein GN244_ATG00682 [Phytophthora infestans]|uniref:Uncharacterized protein n=1 Tax=Phytophthora infestans TaxID=4787 RepID=A0A833TGB6_PHYIN|nr:hypothetical protein GN244_ATG00682 [Phytophthora infestans]